MWRIIFLRYAISSWRRWIMTDGEAQRRAYFRLRYPEDARPLFVSADSEYQVCEISEGGMRLLWPQNSALPSEYIAGLLNLPAESIMLEGRCLRLDESELVLVLSEGIPYPSMVAEQRRLIKKYPALFGR